MNAINAHNLSKLYYLGSKANASLRDALATFVRNPRGVKKQKLWALRDLSFEVAEGETLGIIGRNGAGKSTLLKILSRITKPTSGTAEIRGRVASLLEVGTGFHSELTGRENIYLNGAILGMKHAEIAKKFDEIVDFSEIEKFLDTPVKYYSSGMYMRLAFSVAAHLEPEVLIVDEVLAVGDVEFQKKCLGKMDEVSKSGRTVLFVSHNLGSLTQICKNGMLLHKGRMEFYGGVHDAISRYMSLAQIERRYKADVDKALDMQILDAYVSNPDGQVIDEVPHDQSFFLNLSIDINRPRRGALLCVALLNKYKERVFTEHRPLENLLNSDAKHANIRFGVPKNLIAPNDYSFLLQIFLPSGEIVQDVQDVCPLTIIDTGSDLSAYKDYGYVQIHGDWKVSN